MSFTKKRGRIWWYYWRPTPGAPQKGKSLKTTDGVVAEIKKGEEDKKRHLGGAGLPVTGILWNTFTADFLAGYKPGTKTYETHARTIKVFGDYAAPGKLESVTYAKAKEFRDWLLAQKSHWGRPYKPASINIHLRNLHTLFNEAKRSNYIKENPFDEVKQIPDTKRTPKYFRKDQALALMEEADRSWPQEKALMLCFFLYTGVRLGELVNLRWASIDAGRRLFYLHGSETWEPKDREEHAIGLHPELMKRLKKHPRTSTYVFPGKNGGTRNKRSLRYLFNRLYKRAGITDKSGIHVLRHTFLTHAPLSTKAKQLIAGHADIKTTMRYDHVTPEDLAAVKRVSYSSR